MPAPLRVLLGVSGGIAAIKVPDLVRRLRDNGHEVRCAMTHSASSFVTPLSLEVLTGHPVYQQEYLQANHSGEELHISAARWADVICVVPATCHTLARLALGLADDFLATTILAYSGPLILAPAMEAVMWGQPTVQRHIDELRDRGVILAGPVEGMLATGERGMGRMAEPADIVGVIEGSSSAGSMAGVNVLVSAGPTHEALDPVRFLGNRSSGRMGFALAQEAASRGARCKLVAGPVGLDTPKGVERIDVVSANEMRREVLEHAAEADLIIMTAAVSDFRPRVASSEKLKKENGPPQLELTPNPDILEELAEAAPHAIRVGFAAETNDLEGSAMRKLVHKRADWIVANDVSRPGIGFDSPDNEVTVFQQSGESIPIAKQSKRDLAARLMSLFEGALKERESEPVESRS